MHAALAGMRAGSSSAGSSAPAAAAAAAQGQWFLPLQHSV
jgi:hypothetical protein